MIRYGIIGTGMMGLEHIMNLQHLDGTTVTAIADPHEPSRQAAELLLGTEGVSYFENYADLVASGLVDVVVVATPNMTHVNVLLDLLATDLHILVEKPLCTTVQDCRTVIAAADGRTPVTWVGLEYRYMPPVARLIEEVRAGTIGTVRMLSIREHRFPFLAKVNDWNRLTANTGGTLVEKACHFFDLMNEVIGTAPLTVMASGGQDVNHLDETYDGTPSDVLDNAFVIVEYEGGARAMLDLCMFAEGGTNQSEISAVGEKAKVEAYLPSSSFSIGIRGYDGHSAEEIADAGLFSPATEIITAANVPYMGHHAGSSYVEHTHFRDAILSGDKPEVSLADGLLSVAMGLAAHRSIAEGRIVPMAEILAS